LLSVTGIQPHELFAPDGNTVFWDHEAQVAVSNIWNTQDFVTPLIEVPINQVTPTEAREYEMFRLQYLGLWRKYFDPIGMRLSLGKEQVRMELYILPLVRTSQYNELRRIAGDGTIKIDASVFSDRTLLQYLMHLSPQIFGRDFLGGIGSDL